MGSRETEAVATKAATTEAVTTEAVTTAAGIAAVPRLAALAPAADPGQRAQAGLWLQRTIGNEAMRRLARRIDPNSPQSPPSLSGLGAPPRKTFASRAEMVAALSGSGLWTGPDRADIWAALRWLDAQTVDEIISEATELSSKYALGPVMDQVGAVPDIDNERVRVVGLAVLQAGYLSRASFEIQHAAALGRLSDADRTRVLNLLGGEYAAITDMRKTAGFRALTQAEQERLILLLGSDLSLSWWEPGEMAKLLADPTKDKTSAATFRKFLQDQPGLPASSYWGRNVVKSLGPTKHEYSSPADVKGHAFHSGSFDAKSYQLTIGRLTGAVFTFPVFDPVTRPAAPKELPTLDNLATALSRVPPPVLALIKQVDLNPVANPDDAKWAADPGYAKASGGTFTGSFMTCGADGVVSVYPSTTVHAQSVDELSAALLHESGHAESIGQWGDSAKDKRWAPWQAAMQSDGLSGSKYAQASADEDFAETWLQYMQVRGTLREYEFSRLMPARFAILKQLAP
jgi:hypothetical protein